MTNTLTLPFRIFAIPLLLACSAAPQDDKSLDASAFAARVAKNDAQLVDVRTAAEYANGHIPGALNLDWTGGQLEQRATELDKSRPVLLYCASGRRSAAARQYLLDQGFHDALPRGRHSLVDSGRKAHRALIRLKTTNAQRPDQSGSFIGWSGRHLTRLSVRASSSGTRRPCEEPRSA